MMFSTCLARQPICISEPDSEYIINQIDYFRDKTKTVSIDSFFLNFQNDFVTSKNQNLNFGFTDDAIWIRFSIKNTNIHVLKWILAIKYYFLWDIDLYILQDNQIIQHKKSGILTPSFIYDISHRWYIFNLFLQPEKDYTFLLRFVSKMPIALPISIMTQKQFIKQSNRNSLIKGFFYGILLLVVIYHIYLFGTQKESSYFYFLAFIMTLFFIRFSFDGFTRQIFFANCHQANVVFSNFFPILIPILFLSGILFASSFLAINPMPPIFKTIFLVLQLIWISFGFCIVFGFTHIVPIFPVSAVCTMIVFICYFVFLWKNGYSPAYYYIVGWIFLTSGFVAFSLLRLNYISSNIFTETSMEISIVGMVLCFQFSFIYQMNLIKKQQRVTQIKLLEKAAENEALIRKQKSMLEKVVEQRTRELQDAKDKAEKANLAKSNFFASINHDLRTPLNSILGYAQIYQYTKKSTQECQKGFQAIHESGNYLLSLINDLLDMSKIEFNSFELLPDIMDLKAFIDKIIKTIVVLANQKNILFKTSIQSDLPYGIITDEKRLHQVLINLLGNAVKFTTQGEISFCVKKSEDQMLLQDENTVSLLFEISDTGSGIDQKKIKEIFIPYRQLKNSKQLEGSGLGLSISQSIVKLMGGMITVDSQLGKGSTFCFQITVPSVTEKKIQSSEVGQIPLMDPDSPKLILIVDDILHNRLVLKEFLTTIGCNILLAESGYECIQIATEKKPDLILMDIQMPEIDGIETVRLIRSMDEIKYIPVIAVSASVSSMPLQAILQKGFNDSIMKPIIFEELVDKLKKHLSFDESYEDLDNFKYNHKTESSTDINTESIIKWPVIDIKTAMLRLRNDDILFKQVLKTVLEDVQQYITSLKDSFINSQNENVQQNIHKLKSSFQLIAAKRCDVVVELISEKFNNNSLTLTYIHWLETEWDILSQQIKEITQDN